ncbi:MAG: hypothetical protein Q9175_004873 [Cornicularia normoerica]
MDSKGNRVLVNCEMKDDYEPCTRTASQNLEPGLLEAGAPTIVAATCFSSLQVSNILTFQSPLQRPKFYRVPNSPITLLFIAYAAAPAIAPTVTYQTLLTALNSIYHSTVFNHGDGLIFTNTVSWSHSGAIVSIDNHGTDRTGQLTWGMLADTMYGLGAFFQAEACWSGEWMIKVEGLGDIGSGFVGARVDYKKLESTMAGTAVETA